MMNSVLSASTSQPAGAYRSTGETRLSRRFQELQEHNEKALIAFVTAGDPDMETTRRLVLALDRAGADIVELGIPFSDPLLDGPVIQASAQRALEHGTRVSEVFGLVESLRRETDVPIIFMTCLNPIHRLGAAQFARQSREVGVDGILVTDMPPEEGSEWIRLAREEGLDRIFMLAPTSSTARIQAVAAQASGFIYCQSRAGVTGVQKSVPPDLGDLVSRVRAASDLPIGVGFGISTPEHVRAVVELADGAVVGTAFVRLVGEQAHHPEEAAQAISELAAALKAATRSR